MRALLATITTLLALSGCISDSNAPAAADETPRTDAQGPTVADVEIVKAYDLSLGLSDTTWTFEVAPGGGGEARLSMIGRFVYQLVADPDVCLRWTHEGPDDLSQGTQGSCAYSGAIVAEVDPPHLEPQTVLKWSDLEAGKYAITLSARPQPNFLNVHIVVDNPNGVGDVQS